jgi:hypothetical protein
MTHFTPVRGFLGLNSNSNTTNCNSFATDGKNWSIRKEQKGFLAHPQRAKRFLECKRTSFRTKHNKSSTKATENGREKSF